MDGATVAILVREDVLALCQCTATRLAARDRPRQE